MKASVEQQVALLELQGLDIQLRQLNHRRRTLPEHGELASLEKVGSGLRDAVVAAETEVSDLTRAQEKADADVAQVRSRADRDRARLEAGGAAKDLMGLQHELETLARRQAELEDVELEVMERLEAAQSRLAELQGEQAGHEATVSRVAASRDQATDEIDGQAREVRETRDQRAAGIDDALLSLYTSVSAQSDIGAAELQGSQCGGCRLELTPVDLGAIRRAAADDVMQCEECSCILIRKS